METNQLAVIIQTILDEKGVVNDLPRIQKVLEKYTMNLTAEMDKNALIKSVQSVLPSVIKELRNIPGVQIPIDIDFSDGKLIEKACTQVEQANKRMQAEFAKTAAKSKEIQLSLGNGDFETKILGYETTLKKLGLSSEEITVKMQGVKSAYNELSTSAKGDNIIPDDVVAKAATLNTEMSKLSNTTKQLKLKESLNADQLQVDQTVVRLNEQLRKNSAYSKEAKTQIRAWLDELEKGNVAEARLKQINSEAKQLHANMASANKVGFSWIDKLKNAWSKFGGWSFATGTLMAGVHQTTEAFRELKEVDTYLTEISKANDKLSKSDLSTIGVNSFDIASQYGKTATNYLSAVQEMSRAGYENVDGMAELSTAAQGAGDMTQELANQMIVATDKAYKLNGSVTALKEVLDGINYITNHNAVNMTELSEGMSIVGSTAASFGVEVNELASVLGTMTASTQLSGSEMARAFRGILLNIRQVSDEEENIDAEGLTKYEKACNALGVSLKETKNGVLALRDPMDVLKELSEEYNKLDESDIRRTQLLNSVGGKLRSTGLDALLRQWSTYEKMLDEYSQGSGSMMEEAEKTANSWQGLLNQISNSWTGFIQNFAEDGLVTNTLKFVNELVKGVDGLVESFGALPTLITAIGAGLGAKNIGKCA